MKKLLLSMSLTLMGLTSNINAQSEPFVGEIRYVAFDFAPIGWAKCNGQELPITKYVALFSLLGTYYGGDGRTTFALPDMRGRMPIHAGQGPGLSPITHGQSGGAENVTLTTTQMPAHSHTINAVENDGNSSTPKDNLPAGTKLLDMEYSSENSNTTMKATMVNSTGGSQPHNNMPPYLSLNCIIAYEGIFPSRQDPEVK